METADGCPAHLRRQLGKLFANNRQTGTPGGHHKAGCWSDGLLQDLQAGASSISTHHQKVRLPYVIRTCCPG